MKWTRRNLVKSLAILGGGAVLLPSNLCAKVLESNVPAWDEEWDVIIVGTGFAGVCAAMAAVEEGAKRILAIDKMPYVGGNSAFSAGSMAVAGTDLQIKEGFADSPELHFQDTMKGGGNINDPEIVRVMVTEGVATAKWLESYGVKWVHLGGGGGHSVNRNISAGGIGSNILRPVREQEKYRENVVTRPCVIMDGLVYNSQDAVIGLKVRENYQFDFEPGADERNNKTGRVKYYRAIGGVVLAAGGFAADVKFRDKMDPRVKGITITTNHKGATGYTIENLMKDGIKTVDMDQVQLVHLTSGDENSFGTGYSLINRAVNFGMMVNPKTGLRFVNEMANRRDSSDAMLAMNEGGKNHPVIIMDSVAAERFTYMNTVNRAIEVGAVWKFDKIDDLIAHFKINREPFLEQLKRFNEYVKEGVDPEFGRKFHRPDGKYYPVETPPFYASRPAPKVHHCMGGVKTTTKGEVIHSNGKIIDGLFAAGEITGGTHGTNRLGSNAIADCTVFGRIAGKNAVVRLKKIGRG